jgi:hypothetical protein
MIYVDMKIIYNIFYKYNSSEQIIILRFCTFYKIT